MLSPLCTPVRSTSSIIPGTNTSRAVADGVYLHLFADDVSIDEHGFIFADFHGVFQIFS